MSEARFSRLLSLITEDRLRPSTRGKRGLLIETESDKGRVINSAAFRRLQQKAQVFPLEPNASVRSRLTHSIEVSQVGRHLAQKVIEKVGPETGDYAGLTAFVNTVETACLLHDIGNPPFGHLGESAIKEWFAARQSDNADLKEFDGNPQGFRLISFLMGADNLGLNATVALLLSTIKYPWDTSRKPEGKKIGIFSSDMNSYLRACETIGWEAGKRFPLARLMDTADEIAYSASDLEDGLEKKIIDLDDLREAFPEEKFEEGKVIKPFVDFKTKLIVEAVNEASTQFCQRLDEIIKGVDFELISSSSQVGAKLRAIRTFASARIYSDEAAERVELAGRCIIKGLLDHFGELLSLDESEFVGIIKADRKMSKKFPFLVRLFRRLPQAYVEKYIQTGRGPESTRRAHLIVDFISGMTDDFAMDTYQMLQGIKL